MVLLSQETQSSLIINTLQNSQTIVPSNSLFDSSNPLNNSGLIYPSTIESNVRNLASDIKRLSNSTSDTIFPLSLSNPTVSNTNTEGSPSILVFAYDLLISNPVAPTSANVSSTFATTYGLKNEGTASIFSPITNRFYLSLDSNLDNADTLLGSQSVSSIGANTTVSKSVNLTIPSTVIPGNYYLIYKADASNAIIEGNENNNTAFRQITINSTNPVNNPPVANNDNYTLNEDTIFNLTTPGVLLNDTDSENNSLTSVLVSNPSNGNLTFNPNGTFTYTPNTNFNGNDSFTYKASDGNSFSNIATVNLTINPVNDAPIANNDVINFTNNQPLLIPKATLLANDTDVDSTTLTINSVLNPVNGTVSLVNGDVLFTPNTGFSGVANFNYTITDGSLTSNIASVTLNIPVVVNNSPVANNDNYTLNEDTIFNLTTPGVLLNDTDSENNSLTSVLVSNPSNGTLTFNPNGTFTYTPNTNFNGNDSFTYKASDGNSFSNIATVNLTINPVNDAPVANNDNITIVNTGSVTILKTTLLANDTDVDSTTLTINSVFNPVNGTVSLVNGDVLFTTNTGFSGVANFNYTITDGSLTSNTATVTITVNPNQTPNYSNIDGYGIVNAAKAVASAINQATFADVPNIDDNYNLDLIKAPEVWNQGYTGQGVIVAVLDDGFGLNYSGVNYWKNTNEIAGNGIDDDNNGYIDDYNGWNAYNNNGTITYADHGTHVMGIVGDRNNGVAYGASIMPIQVFGSGGGSWTAVEQGIYYAVKNGAKVINMSLGGGAVTFIKTAIAYAESQGVNVVSAAGNDRGDSPIYPAGFATEYGIAVGSVGGNGVISYFSNRAGTDSRIAYVTAPGEDIISVNGGKSGTSMSSPNVAGVVALMLSANPNLTPTQVKTILKNTSGSGLQPSALQQSTVSVKVNLENFLIVNS